MKIKWLGHACFEIKTAEGIVVLTDPFDKQVGYPKLRVKADLVLVSHQHFDHNAVSEVSGSPTIIQSEGEHLFKGVKVTGIRSFHDKVRGTQRGDNLIFILESEDLRICHLGDLGHTLDKSLQDQMGKIDILLIPVGGLFTIDAAEAVHVVNQINPRYVLPMHYKTRYVSLPINSVEPFLAYFIEHVTRQELEVTSSTQLPEKPQVIVLELTQC